MKKYQRNFLEFLAIILLGEAVVIIENSGYLGTTALYTLVVGICWLKTAWFVYETSQDLNRATTHNLPYHQFLKIVGINMTQVMLSFGIDYYTLLKIDMACLNEINPAFNELELLSGSGIRPHKQCSSRCFAIHRRDMEANLQYFDIPIRVCG